LAIFFFLEKLGLPIKLKLKTKLLLVVEKQI